MRSLLQLNIEALSATTAKSLLPDDAERLRLRVIALSRWDSEQ